jgi:hypothetical protein
LQRGCQFRWDFAAGQEVRWVHNIPLQNMKNIVGTLQFTSSMH